jgi:hypothetical protein
VFAIVCIPLSEQVRVNVYVRVYMFAHGRACNAVVEDLTASAKSSADDVSPATGGVVGAQSSLIALTKQSMRLKPIAPPACGRCGTTTTFTAESPSLSWSSSLPSESNRGGDASCRRLLLLRPSLECGARVDTVSRENEEENGANDSSASGDVGLLWPLPPMVGGDKDTDLRPSLVVVVHATEPLAAGLRDGCVGCVCVSV